MPTPKPKIPLERQDQQAYFEWLYWLKYQGERVWNYAAAMPNGSFRGDNRLKAARHANLMTLQGMKRGYPDVILDIAVAPYHGLRIEFKRIGAGKPGSDQSMWHARLRKQGYFVAVCYGILAAQAVTLEYLQIKDHPHDTTRV
jgi:hypothetical protein